jgi:hypothetical protein
VYLIPVSAQIIPDAANTTNGTPIDVFSSVLPGTVVPAQDSHEVWDATRRVQCGESRQSVKTTIGSPYVYDVATPTDGLRKARSSYAIKDEQ